MADVLICFVPDDREAAAACGEQLARAGFDVQFDAPVGRRRGRLVPRQEAQSAKVILVLWSATALRSRPLLAEADFAAATGRLIGTHVKTFPVDRVPAELQGYVAGSVGDHHAIAEALLWLGAPSRQLNGHAPEPADEALLASHAWSFVDAKGDPRLIHDFMRRFPGNEFAARAQARLVELHGADAPDGNASRPMMAFAGVVLLGVVIGLIAAFSTPKRELERVLVAAGGADGAYLRLLQRYNEHLRPLGVELVAHAESRTGFSNIQLLADGKVQGAFVKGGFAGALRDPEYMNDGRIKTRGKEWDHDWSQRLERFHSLGRVMLEPLWVFTFGSSETSRLNELNGEPVNIGSMESGTRNLAALLLERNGVRFKPGMWLGDSMAPPKAGEPRPLGEARALFLSQPAETPLVQALLNNLTGEKEFDKERIVRSAAFSADGKRLVVALGDRTARVWDAGSGREIAKLTGHEDEVNDTVFSPDGRRVASASDDDTIRIWDAETGVQLAAFKGSGKDINSVAFSPDGRRIVSASDSDRATIRDAETGAILLRLEGHGDDVNSAAFSHDGRRVVTASRDNTAIIFDAATGARLRVLRGHDKAVASAAFSHDDKLIVTASWDMTARIWDAETGLTRIILGGHTDLVRAAEFSPDGSMVITASWDDTGRVWDVASGEEIRRINGLRSNVNSAAFSPDGRLAMTASQDSHVRLWDTKTWKVVHDFTAGGSADGVGHARKLHLMNFAADADAYISRFPFLSKVQLPKGSVKFEPHVPAETVTLLATSVAFVVDKHWAERHRSVVRVMADAITHKPLPGIDETTRKPRLFHRSGQYPTLSDPEYEVSPLAVPVYRTGDVPFLLGKLARMQSVPFSVAAWIDEHAGTLVLSLIPLLGILIPLIRFVPAIYNWTVRRRILYWYRRLQVLESRLDIEDRVAHPERSTPEIDRIDSAVSKIRVPLNYSDQYYDLRSHIELVRQRLAARLASNGAKAPAPPA